MNRETKRTPVIFWPLLALACCFSAATAQVAVPEIEEIQEIPVISASEIEELVGPIALYPDDLLAIVLPAATFPLQIVEAGRFLEALEDNPSLEPDDDWDDSIVALLNYPEVVELLNEDLDWTWRLGEAVVGQQSDVIAAIERFRDEAYAAGNLKSDDYQLVAEEGGTIQITPAQEDVIYVPYYEPSEVVVYQPTPVYYYYPRPYPVYYYPYPAYYSFHDHFHHHWFWGVTTAYSIAWHTHHLSVFHHSFYGHPYYGYSYRDRWWYRRPDIHIHNNVYVRNNVNVSNTRYRTGDRWLPSDRRTVGYSDGRITRSRFYSNTDSRSNTGRTVTRTSGQRPTTGIASNQFAGNSDARTRRIAIDRHDEREKIEFRPRTSRQAPDRSTAPATPSNRNTVSAAPTRPSTTRSTFVPQPAATRSRSTPEPKVTRSSPAPRPAVRSSSRAPSPSVSRPAPAPRPTVGRQVPKPSVAREAPAPRPSARRSGSSPKPATSRPAPAPKPSASRSESKPESSRSRTSRSGERSSRRDR